MIEFIEHPHHFLAEFSEVLYKDPVSWDGWKCLHIASEKPLHLSSRTLEELCSMIQNALEETDGRMMLIPEAGFFLFCKITHPTMLEEAAFQCVTIIQNEYSGKLEPTIFDMCRYGISLSGFLQEINSHYNQIISLENYTMYETVHADKYQPVLHIKPNVLLIEDDALAGKMASNVLGEHCNVTLCTCLQEAIDYYRNHVPDCVFLDIGMPDGDGRLFLASLKEYHPETPVIMFSANDDLNTIMQTLQVGANGFVSKPLKPEKMTHYIHNLAKA